MRDVDIEPREDYELRTISYPDPDKDVEDSFDGGVSAGLAYSHRSINPR